ncbi:alpha/beta hydrolase (plasmid) [Pseudosulfitobacter pseudonitzschiae]|uniref:alpha/beta hydrolase n=1 Tax=Pseudosulfitobacter pseudonitzschiae TaxID=1402135 RepID=UPI001D92A7FE|nr:alpha/beta hydrolase [Pseudosulfitobacter pseudonitzschiae]MBM1817921.1 alpha/beta hydrolase [Pseudosulfitobacter pseudonitzschiae]MBM1844694.1 alpha/beta hydrolase [Pseudosulfitobacter pseudonitzschiae]MBM1854326.1 alpha/beta hydrolase [Pseudosulfitobacter pseudonitzschiae]MBM1859242.1 alpha/beta hydrolase [Pseudosulfitobacter pseudonitzschiae]MBM1883454.1 alpha/beta hydrolase [Pseudosulfitobacter pseudonitzschiae]
MSGVSTLARNFGELRVADQPQSKPDTASDDRTDTTELDLDIVSDTFRAFVDQAAFDSLIERWNQKLNALDSEASILERHFSTAFFKQMDVAADTLDRLDAQIFEDPLEKVVAEVAGPAVVISPDLRVASVNVEGEQSFGASQGTFLSLDYLSPESRVDFDTVLRTAKGHANLGQTIVQVLDRSTGEPAFRAEAFLLKASNQDSYYIVIRSLELEWSSEVSTTLSQAFDLTDAEIDVARQFFENCDLAAVAALRKVSVHTVRTQMKTILSKTGATSQAELIRLFSMVASRQMLRNRGLLTEWQDPLGREEILMTNSGRKIAWTWMGAPDGTPAIFLRGMAMGYLLPESAEKMLKRAGVKLLIPSRPGYGNSSLHEDLPVLEDNRVMLEEFLVGMGLKGCVGIGLSDGIIPLLAQQDKDPDTFSALISVGFNGCLNRAAFRRLPVPQATLLRLAKTAPRLLDLIARIGQRMIARYGVDWYLERAHASTPLDLQICRDPRTATLVRDACSHLVVQGTRTFVRDMQMFHAPVDSAIDELAIPMLSMVPTEDGLFDIHEYRQLEKRNARVKVLPVPESADLLIYQKTNLIMDRIIEIVTTHNKLT